MQLQEDSFIMSYKAKCINTMVQGHEDDWLPSFDASLNNVL